MANPNEDPGWVGPLLLQHPDHCDIFGELGKFSLETVFVLMFYHIFKTAFKYICLGNELIFSIFNLQIITTSMYTNPFQLIIYSIPPKLLSGSKLIKAVLKPYIVFRV